MHFREGESFEINQEIVDKVVKEKVSILHFMNAASARAIMCVPLWVQEEVIGLIFLEISAKPTPSAWDLDTLTIIANQMAIALENISLYHELVEKKDALTRENVELKIQLKTVVIPAIFTYQRNKNTGKHFFFTVFITRPNNPYNFLMISCADRDYHPTAIT